MAAECVADHVIVRLSEFLANNTGLHFPPERRSDLRRGLSGAATEFGFANAAACADWLLSTNLTRTQLHTFASHLTVGETYFFRERKTLDALAEHVLPELIRSRRGRDQRLRLWSAACSTGEEPYSLAILARQLLPDWHDWRVTILATDINDRSLRKAAAAEYGDWSFRDPPSGLKDRYFTRTHSGTFSVVPEIKSCVTFAPLNLVLDAFPSLATGTNAMDVILCRNVLIYFAAPQTRSLIDKLHHALADGGWLAVSPSECSQALFSQFSSVTLSGSILYRKRTADERTRAECPAELPSRAVGSVAQALPVASSTPPTSLAVLSTVPATQAAKIAECAASPAPAVPWATVELLYEDKRYSEVADLLLVAPVDAMRQLPRALSMLARALANQGRLTEALVWSERVIAADKLTAAVHYLHAMILQELGRGDDARRSLQRAVFLEPTFALAHFALGNLARESARDAEASRHFANALDCAGRLPPEEPLPESDGLTAGRLTDIIQSLAALRDPGVSPADGSEHARYKR